MDFCEEASMHTKTACIQHKKMVRVRVVFIPSNQHPILKFINTLYSYTPNDRSMLVYKENVCVQC